MDSRMTQRIDDAFELLRRIRSDHPWQHAYIQHLAALSYAVSGRPYDKVELRTLMERIRVSFGRFSTFRSSAFLLAVFLLTGTDDSDLGLERLIAVESILREEGIRSYAYGPLLAMVLVRTSGQDDLRSRVQATLECQEELRRAHPFLTGVDDYPFAAMLSASGASVSSRLADVETLYTLLHQEGLRNGNGLQLLSLILALGEGTPEERVERVANLLEGILTYGIRVWPQYYGALGLLALFPGSEETISDEVSEIALELHGRKYYRSLGKGMLLLFATILRADETIRNEASTTAGVLLETLIQAQAAAMVAVTVSITAASSASS